MKKFLHSHPNIVIGVLAVAFIVVLVSFYFWAIGGVFDQIDRALAAPLARSAIDFDLLGASKLNLRGLLNGETPAAAIAPPLASTTATSTPVASSSTSTP